MKQILYSYPPGTGGDHVCTMLMDQPLQLQGRRAQSAVTIRHAEHQVRAGRSSMQEYLRELRDLRYQNPVIINCHDVDLPGREDMTCVRAVWSDPDMTWQWICRDIMSNNWCKDVVPYITADLLEWITNRELTPRHRLLRFLRHQHRHGVWHSEESVPQGWHRFYLDRMFTLDFVEDVLCLAGWLGLAVDADRVAENHATWLQANQPRDFTSRRAVRYLEAAGVLELL